MSITVTLPTDVAHTILSALKSERETMRAKYGTVDFPYFDRLVEATVVIGDAILAETNAAYEAEEAAKAAVEMFDFRVGLRLFETGERSARIIRAATVEDAIAAARVGAWKDSTVASVSIVKGKK
jgi:hypothetical protein